jgi:hypothetical protein
MLAFYSIATLGYYHTSEPNFVIAKSEFLLLLFTLPFVIWYFTENVRFIFDLGLDLLQSGEENG